MVNSSIKKFKNEIKYLKQYPLKFIENNSVIKLVENSECITIGRTKNANEEVLELLKEYHYPLKLTVLNVDGNELTSYLSKNSNNFSEEVDKANLNTDLNKLTNDAPIINLVNSIIIDGINMNSSDIHIEGFKDSVRLRYRVDGVLIDFDTIKRSLFPSISSRIKIMANLNIMEKRKPQDGRISVTLSDKQVDLRISIVPLSSGESIVLRLFVKKEKIKTLKDLGYNGDNLQLLNRVMNLPHGLVLITGPTGSGKTTTLNAILKKINSSEKKIVTIEDPIEYTVDGVNQIQVNNELKMGFNNILRRVLRQDPDIIMIGEIRDKETAELVVRASLTGHLVLSTLHTNDSVSAIPRLQDLGVPNYLITSVLKASFAQRLVRKLCSFCDGKGCDKCSDRGFRGRIAISEGFIMNEILESLILDGAKSYEIKNYLEKIGMKTLISSGLEIVNNNITTTKELERVLVI